MSVTVEETRRPLTPQEHAILVGLRRAPASGGARFGGLLAFLVTLGSLLIVAPGSRQHGVRSLVPVIIAGVVGAAVFFRLRRAGRRDPWYQQLDQDLQEGIATVTTYHVTDAISVEEIEDEGSQYYLLLQDDRVLFLAGQYLYEPEEEGRFPCTLVSVVRAPHTGTVLDFQCAGTPVAVSSRREPFSAEQHRHGSVPDDGAVLEVDFESIRSGSHTV